MRSNESTLIKQGLTLNFLEVIFNKDELSLLKTKYSHDLYTEYKRNPNFYIYRYDDDLYIWELRPTKELLPDTFKGAQVTVEEHAPIFTKIVEQAIATFFSSNNYLIFKQRYSPIWEVELKQEKQGIFRSLALRPTLVFSLRNLYSKLEKKQIIALTV